MLADLVKRAGRMLGLEIARFRPAGPRRARLLADYGIKLVLDVGAHRGQYAQELRRHGFEGRIISFEPLGKAFDELARAAARDPAWECRQLALGDCGARAPIWVASNLASSSLLRMLDNHTRAAPEVEVVAEEVVEVCTLDSLDLELDVPMLLKLDVQGYEDRVLAGARRTLEDVSLIECELSLEPLYDSQASLLEMLTLLSDTGYQLVALEPGFHDRDGKTLQVEAILARR